MGKKELAWLLCGIAVLGALWGGSALRERQDAEKLALQADRLLRAPLTEAPELTDVQASRAASLLSEARLLSPGPRIASLLHHARAIEHLQRGRLDKARKSIAAARRIAGDTAELRVVAAAVQAADGDGAGARAHVDKALMLHGDDMRALVMTADFKTEGGQPAEALAILERMLKRLPGAAMLYNRRGLAREALGDKTHAMDDYRAASRLDAGAAHPHINRGRLLRELNQLQQAERAFSMALDRGPGEADAWLGRALCRMGLEDVAGADMDVRKARALDPGSPGVLVVMGDIDVLQGDLDTAVIRYQASLALDRGNATGWLKLGNALVRLKKHGDAASAFESAIEIAPKLAAAHNGLGAAQMLLDNRQGAEKALQRAASLDTSDPNPLLNLAQLRKRAGDLEGARKAYARALDRDPELHYATLDL